MKRIILALIVVTASAAASAQAVDLTASKVYVRRNFDDSWTRALPEAGNTAWTVVEPGPSSWPMVMRDVPLLGAVKQDRWSLVPRLPEDWTVVFPFEGELTLINMSDPAVYLAQVGGSWAMYLNGVLLHSEMKRSPGGGYVQRSLHGVLVSLDKRRLVRGQNLLAIRIHGDPADDRTGFNLSGPYVIDSFRVLSASNREYLELMFIGVYFFFAAYHLVLFALRPAGLGYLYFGTSTFLLALYMAARTRVIATLVLDTALVQRVEYLALFLLVPSFLAFLESMMKERTSRATKAVAGAYAVLALLSQLFRHEPFLYVWYALSAAVVLYYLVFLLGSSLAGEFRRLASLRSGPRLSRWGRALLELIPGTIAGKLAAGSLILAAAAAADAASNFSGGGMGLVKYASFVFLFGAAALLAGRFTEVYAGLEAMSAGLKATVEERTADLSRTAAERTRMNEELAVANRGYRDVMDARERDMSIAVSVQQGFFPRVPPRLKDWDIAFAFEPASGVSGDFYDFYESEGELRGLVIGDVSGHGIASGLITLLARNIFFRRTTGREKDSLGTLFSEVNRELVRELSSVDNYLTAAFMRMDGPRVEYVNAAHTDALFRKDGRKDPIVLAPKGGDDYKAPPLGREGLDVKVKTLSFAMGKGDCVFLYTDCLTEGRDKRGQEYGFERLVEAFRKADTETAESTLASIMIDYRNFTSGGKRADDLTAIVLMRRR